VNALRPVIKSRVGRRAFGLMVGRYMLGSALVFGTLASAVAQNIELRSLDVVRQDGAVLLNFVVQPTLSKPVEEAMQRGIALYFEAQATVYRPRWYWRDERIARVSRSWRLAYQPLTSSWRVSQGGALQQTVATAAEALTLVSRAAAWKLADADQIEPGDKAYVEFSYRLDNAQLPKPMQLDLGVQADWRLQVERTLKLD
jgi:hypothetical protein